MQGIGTFSLGGQGFGWFPADAGGLVAVRSCTSTEWDSIRIPLRYHFGMSQISIRLPDEMVAYLDGEVNGHRASSRAALVLRALERERRRQIAARDAEILAKVSSEDDMDSLATHVDNLSRDLA